MPTDTSNTPPGAVPAASQRSALPDFLAWLGACLWFFLAIAIPFSASGKHLAGAIFTLILLVAGYTMLIIAALVIGIARKTPWASLAGVLVSAPLVVVAAYFFLLAE